MYQIKCEYCKNVIPEHEIILPGNDYSPVICLDCMSLEEIEEEIEVTQSKLQAYERAKNRKLESQNKESI